MTFFCKDIFSSFVVNNALNLVPELGIRSRWHEHVGISGAIPGGLGEKLLPVPRLPVPVPGPVQGAESGISSLQLLVIPSEPGHDEVVAGPSIPAAQHQLVAELREDEALLSPGGLSGAVSESELHRLEMPALSDTAWLSSL